MAGAFDLFRRGLPLGILLGLVVLIWAPAARADDASAAADGVSGAAIAEQAQPANVNVSVRVDSPGENGTVTQANSAGASAAGGVSVSTDGVSAPGGVSATAGGAQAGPANVNVSVRVDSPGDDGAVKQTNTAGGAAASGTASSEGGASAPAAAATQESASTPAATATQDSASTPTASATPQQQSTPKAPSSPAAAGGDGAPGVTVDSGTVTAPGVSVSETTVSAPAATVSPQAVATPAAAADGSGTSTPAATTGTDSADASGVPDTWTWVWNWTGACVDAPNVSTRSGWTWVWNWTCSDAAPGPAATPGGGASPGAGTPVEVSDTPAAPAADSPLLSTPTQQATPRSHGSKAASTASSGGTPAGRLVLASASAVSPSLFTSPTSPGVVSTTAPRAHAAPPAARATPVRERDRRGGRGGGSPHTPFGPDPTSPLAATGASGGGSGFVLLLLMALAAAVTLTDPAGSGQRVAAAVAGGVDRIARRIDRPG